jgi:ABC-type lipoprotein export system ATPase subunit
VVTEAVFRGRDLTKTYRRGDELVHALRSVNLELRAGELVALVGPSGSGKSTLLNVLCGWEHVESGSLQWGEGLTGRPPEQFTWSELALVPQALGLLDDLTVRENILMPARLSGRLREESARADALMASVGISHLAGRHPKQTSLGEQQRCAVMRALLLRPRLLLADEPTAHQDAHWTEVMFTAMRELVDAGSVCLVATHNPETWDYADRILSMHDGELREGAPETVH